MALRKLPRSQKYRHRGKDTVLVAMDGKLAGGRGAYTERKRRERMSGATRAVLYGGSAIVFLCALALVLLQLLPRKVPEQRESIVYVNPVALVGEAARAGRIDADSQAVLLRELLLAYSRVPAAYRPEYPRFTAGDIIPELQNLWPRLKEPTRMRLAPDFPGLGRRQPRL